MYFDGGRKARFYLYFERPLEKFERQFQFPKTPLKNTVDCDLVKHTVKLRTLKPYSKRFVSILQNVGIIIIKRYFACYPLFL